MVDNRLAEEIVCSSAAGSGEHNGMREVRFSLPGIFKISVVTGKREYRIYREFIGDTKKLSDKIYKKKHSFCSENHAHQFYIILDKKKQMYTYYKLSIQ